MRIVNLVLTGRIRPPRRLREADTARLVFKGRPRGSCSFSRNGHVFIAGFTSIRVALLCFEAALEEIGARPSDVLQQPVVVNCVTVSHHSITNMDELPRVSFKLPDGKRRFARFEHIHGQVLVFRKKAVIVGAKSKPEAEQVYQACLAAINRE